MTIRLSEIQEDILWELRGHSIEASDPEWCSAADNMLDQGLVEEDNGIYSITEAGWLALKATIDRRGILRG